jgi:hypothetical protein
MSRLSDTAGRRPLETSEKVLAVGAALGILLVVLHYSGLAPLPPRIDDLVIGMTFGLAFAVVVNAVLRAQR